MILGKLKDVDCKSLFSFSNMGIEALPNGKPGWRPLEPLEYEFNEPDDVSLAAATSIRKPELKSRVISSDAIRMKCTRDFASFRGVSITRVQLRFSFQWHV